MQLKEIVNELLKRKFHNSQREMAQALEIGEMDLRRLAGIVPGSRRNQEKIFQITLKVLPMCDALGIDPAQELKQEGASQQEKRMHHVTQGVKKLRAGDVSKDLDPKGDNKVAQRGKKHLPPGGIHGGQGRKA